MHNSKKAGSVVLSRTENTEDATTMEDAATTLKQQRGALMNATAHLLKHQPLNKVSLSAIAAEANLSKENICRAFESKETLLVHFVLEPHREWLETLITELEPLKGSDDKEAVVRVLVHSLAVRPSLATLISALSSALERNSADDSVVDFKRAAFKQLQPLVTVLEAALPSLSETNVMLLLTTMMHLTGNLWQAAYPSPAYQEVFASIPASNRAKPPESSSVQGDFERHMRQCLNIFLRGLTLTTQ